MNPRSSVVPFPHRDTPPPLGTMRSDGFPHCPPMVRVPTSDRLTADVRMAEIARRLGIADEAWRTIIAKIRLLNGRYSFPDPRNPRIVKGALLTGPDAIVRRSVFPRSMVEEWFDNHRAPAMRVVEDASEAKAARSALAANSRNLVAQLGRSASC